jgi:hypothetical protein
MPIRQTPIISKLAVYQIKSKDCASSDGQQFGSMIGDCESSDGKGGSYAPTFYLKNMSVMIP